VKTLASIVLGLLASYFTLLWVVGHLDTLSQAMCSTDFTLPALACRFGGLGITLLLIPLAGAATFLVARGILAKLG